MYGCAPITAVCDDLPPLGNGTIDYSPDEALREVNTTASYSCDPGFEYEGGDEVRTCEEVLSGSELIGGTFTGEEGQCIRKLIS